MPIIRQIGTLLSLALTACAGATISSAQIIPTPTPGATNSTAAQTPLPGNLDQVVFIEDNQQYIISQLLPRDAIRPIYDPQFVPADDAVFDPGELVMGVEINGDARAYPVGYLRQREMVNDVVGGVPILVTW
jgi:hypothetical protein